MEFVPFKSPPSLWKFYTFPKDCLEISTPVMCRTGRQHESLPPSMPTGLGLQYKLLPQSLSELGYSTHAVGKWHLGYCSWDYTPTRQDPDLIF